MLELKQVYLGVLDPQMLIQVYHPLHHWVLISPCRNFLLWLLNHANLLDFILVYQWQLINVYQSLKHHSLLSHFRAIHQICLSIPNPVGSVKRLITCSQGNVPIIFIYLILNS